MAIFLPIIQSREIVQLFFVRKTTFKQGVGCNVWAYDWAFCSILSQSNKSHLHWATFHIRNCQKLFSHLNDENLEWTTHGKPMTLLLRSEKQFSSRSITWHWPFLNRKIQKFIDKIKQFFKMRIMLLYHHIFLFTQDDCTL